MFAKKMWRAAGPLVLVSALSACGSMDSDGTVASGPLGQQPLMTPDVQMATRAGIDACADVLTGGVPLASLATRGFEPWRGGYRTKIDNPLIFAGDSAVAVSLDRRGACYVKSGPLYPIELQTLRSVTTGALAGRGAGLDASFMRAGDSYVVILR